jgi:hypothetical protein
MSLHMPDVCYPMAGYRQAGYPLARTVTLEGVREPHRSASYRALLYARPGGVGDEFDEVVYTRRLRGRWTLDLAEYKDLQRAPESFKVYVQRRVAPAERAIYEQGLSAHLDSPGEAFLRILLSELEAMLAGRRPDATPAPPPAPAAAPAPPGRAR